MVRMLIRAAIFLGSAALGLLAATWLLPEVKLGWSGWIVAVVVFALIQSIINPFMLKLAAKNAPAFLGGIGLVSTFVALFVASLFPAGLAISGFRTWILATLVVWLVTAIATMFLPMIFLKKAVDKKRSGSAIPGI